MSMISVVSSSLTACQTLEALRKNLQYRDILAVSLASDVNVKFRKVILEKFKDNQLTLLLATDLLARGIDIDSLECGGKL